MLIGHHHFLEKAHPPLKLRVWRRAGGTVLGLKTSLREPLHSETVIAYNITLRLFITYCVGLRVHELVSAEFRRLKSVSLPVPRKFPIRYLDSWATVTADWRHEIDVEYSFPA